MRGQFTQPRYIAGYNPPIASAVGEPYPGGQPMIYPGQKSDPIPAATTGSPYNSYDQQGASMPYMPQQQQPMPYSIQAQPGPVTQPPGGYYTPGQPESRY